jgi:Protein of unknown function (DUF3485)
VLVVAALFSTPSMIFAKSVSVVDTELREDSGHAQKVLTKLDLAKNESLQSIPTKLGNWTLARTYEWDNIGTLLNANVLLSRDYSRPDLLQPVNLLIVQSTNVSSFHPAPVCYQVQGWTVHDNGTVENVPIPNATWSQQAWLSNEEPFVFHGNLTAKVLDVTKGTGANATEHVTMYVYLKKEDWKVTNDITWVRMEISVPVGSDIAPAVRVMSDLFAAAVPNLFSFDAGHEATLAEGIVAKLGPSGWGLVGVAVAMPLGLTLIALRRRAPAK